MKLTEAPSKIIGLTLGELSISMLRPDMSPFKARFALITKSGDSVGFMDIDQWSDKTVEAMRTFISLLEEEALIRISETTPVETSTPPETTDQPPQF